ncbi:hypothetical protein J1605_013718 [Eschrichtius robustus]|uniref:Basic proline-rich protein-like n=1 Tax=Eschrichtius robustus TaxID=9764 RepID=A0AB34GFV2_ESCRO|nr:hypothetical protein J1605_013718 [Eschrichtius robustus]
MRKPRRCKKTEVTLQVKWQSRNEDPGGGRAASAPLTAHTPHIGRPAGIRSRMEGWSPRGRGLRPGEAAKLLGHRRSPRPLAGLGAVRAAGLGFPPGRRPPGSRPVPAGLSREAPPPAHEEVAELRGAQSRFGASTAQSPRPRRPESAPWGRPGPRVRPPRLPPPPSPLPPPLPRRRPPPASWARSEGSGPGRGGPSPERSLLSSRALDRSVPSGAPRRRRRGDRGQGRDLGR